ncbi:MAG: Gfo/Idh/MocA family oxidoreductase [Victivallales bacterium]|jgi:predicted dehydrogenase|nr:Gfo/Idh/MocA family oxidoreductase [Victivallales bacterium]
MKKIAIAGLSHIHLPDFVRRIKLRSSVEVVALWDHDCNLAKKYALELNCKSVSKCDALWRDPEVDAIIVCSETNLHKDIVPFAATAGKHLFVEKPLGFAASDALEMAKVVEKSGVLFQTGYFMRGRSPHMALKEMVQSGVFGKITRVRHVNCHCGSLGGWFDTDYRWMTNPEIAGCGAFGDLGTHSLDILMWLFGMPESVTADIAVVTGRYGDKCDETGSALLRFPDGMVATMSGAWVDLICPITCEVSGTEGFAYIRNEELFVKSNKLENADGETPWKNLPDELPHAFDLFLDALEGKNVPLVSASEAAQRNVVMEALYRAAASHSWITL